MLEFIDNEDEDECDSWIRESLERLQRRYDLKIPFVVEGQDHFGQANHAPVLLEHMLDKRDGVLDVYDDKGVPSAAGSETKHVNESIPLRQIGELEELCCDGFYIRGFHSWDATEAAVGADLLTFGTATHFLDTKIFPDACLEMIKGTPALTTGMARLGGELLTLIATAAGKGSFVPRGFMGAIGGVINAGTVQIDCLMRTDEPVGFPYKRGARSADVATFNSGGNGTTVSFVVFRELLELAGVKPGDVRVVQRGGSVPFPLRDLEQGEDGVGFLGDFGKAIDEGKFERSRLKKILSGAISANVDLAFDVSTGQYVSPGIPHRPFAWSSLTHAHEMRCALSPQLLLGSGKDGWKERRDIGTLNAEPGTHVGKILVVQQLLMQQLQFGGFGGPVEGRNHMGRFPGVPKKEMGGSVTFILKKGGKNYHRMWATGGEWGVSVCCYMHSFLHRYKAHFPCLFVRPFSLTFWASLALPPPPSQAQVFTKRAAGCGEEAQVQVLDKQKWKNGFW